MLRWLRRILSFMRRRQVEEPEIERFYTPLDRYTLDTKAHHAARAAEAGMTSGMPPSA